MRNIFLAALIFTSVGSFANSDSSPMTNNLKELKGSDNAKRKAFEAYLYALLNRRSALTPKQEEYFVKKSLELKIFPSEDRALKFVKVIKERINATIMSSQPKIGFTKEPNPSVQSPNSGSTTKYTIGFNDKPNPSVRPPNNGSTTKHTIGFNDKTNPSIKSPSSGSTTKHTIGFNDKANPSIQAPSNGPTTKHTIGFNNKANPSIQSPNSNIIKSSPKIGFNLTMSTAAVAKRLLAFTSAAGGAVAGILLSPEESIAAEDYENYLLDNHPKGAWDGSLKSNSNPNKDENPTLAVPTRSSGQDGAR